MNQYLIGIGAALLIILGVEKYGEHRIQVQWDKDIAQREAVAKHDKDENAKNLADLKDKWKKEKNDAESEAGKRAVAKYLRDAGLLPSSLPVRKCDSGQANIPQGTDSTTSESGLTERITQLAGRCIEDARKVEMCSQWAARENLPVE